MKLWRLLRNIYAPKNPQLAKLRFEQLQLVAHNHDRIWFYVPAIGAILTGAFSRWSGAEVALGWYSAVLLTLVPFQIVARKLRDEHDFSKLQYWTTRFVGTYVIASLAWVSMGFVFGGAAGTGHEVEVTLFLCATIAGAAVLCGPSAAVSIPFFAVYITALLIATAIGPKETHTWPLLSVIYALATCSVAASVYNSARNLILLKERNAELARNLEVAKEVSDTARMKAEVANRTKSDFLASMSHELRTPLNAILGFSEIIKNEMLGPTPSEHYRAYADDIHASGQHLLGLINDILDLAKIEAGRMELRESKVSVRDVTASVLRMFEKRASDAGVRIVSDIRDNLTLLCDERALLQILLNLVSNAVKYTPYGGRVTLCAREAPDGSAILSVADTGVGIAEADLDRVFQTFGQGRHQMAASENGTGLGLPIVKGLVEAHGGKVTLASAPGAGTTVTVTLPARRVVHAAAATAA